MKTHLVLDDEQFATDYAGTNNDPVERKVDHDEQFAEADHIEYSEVEADSTSSGLVTSPSQTPNDIFDKLHSMIQKSKVEMTRKTWWWYWFYIWQHIWKQIFYPSSTQKNITTIFDLI